MYLGSLSCCWSPVPHPVNISSIWQNFFKSQGRGIGKRCSCTSLTVLRLTSSMGCTVPALYLFPAWINILCSIWKVSTLYMNHSWGQGWKLFKLVYVLPNISAERWYDLYEESNIEQQTMLQQHFYQADLNIWWICHQTRWMWVVRECSMSK